MSSIYGDNIFEYNLDFMYNSIMESSKLFEDFNIVTEAEANFKDRIISAIKTIIKKIKEFFIWIKDKILKFVKGTIAEVKNANLKKKLDNLKQKLKNRSNNESAILMEATYEQLEDWLKNTEYNLYKIRYINQIFDIINRGNYYKMAIERDDVILSYKIKLYNPHLNAEDIIRPYKVNVERFVLEKDENLNELSDIITQSESMQNKFNVSIKDLEKELKKITQKNIQSTQDLAKVLTSKREIENLRDKITILDNHINILKDLTLAATSCINDIRKSVKDINRKLKSV